MASQQHYQYDNSWIVQTYNKDAGERVNLADSFGQIKRMFYHTVNGQEEVIVECDWYEECANKNPKSKLRQVKRNLNYDACRFVFLNTCKPCNVVTWSSDPWDDECELRDVIFV